MTEQKRILLVDDDANDVALTLKALDRHGLREEVAVLRDGAQALDYLRRQGGHAQRPKGQPAVLLLDIKMPKVDGIEVLRQIKKDPELRTLPVVMLTSSREERDLTSCYQLGVNGYVVKPVKFPVFMEAVGEVGVFWGKVNEAPPGSMPRGANATGGAELPPPNG